MVQAHCMICVGDTDASPTHDPHPRPPSASLDHLVRAAGRQGRGLLTSWMTPRMEDAVRERRVGEGDVQEGDAVRDGDALPQEGDVWDTGMRLHMPLHPYSSLMPALANMPPAHGTCLPPSTCHSPTPMTAPIRIPPPTGHPGSPHAPCLCPRATLCTPCPHRCIPTNHQPPRRIPAKASPHATAPYRHVLTHFDAPPLSSHPLRPPSVPPGPPPTHLSRQ